MVNYQEISKIIIENTFIKEDEIFDFELSPYKEEFNSSFKFYYEALKVHSYYGIEPNLLFYKNEYSVNAAACKQNGFYIVYINMGTLVYLITRFKENTNLIDRSIDIELLEFEKKLDVPINILMYQVAKHFTFYHEMAHLVQQSDLLENGLFENRIDNDKYSFINHLLELDADKFSALCVGEHILQYSRNLFGKNINNDQIEKLLVITCSSALFYILSFNTNKEEIYYEKYSHPHPIIRITCIVSHIVNYTLQVLNLEKYDITVTITDILKKTIRLSNKLALNKFKENIIDDYQTILNLEQINILNYIGKFIEEESNNPMLAIYKWNQLTRN